MLHNIFTIQLPNYSIVAKVPTEAITIMETTIVVIAIRAITKAILTNSIAILEAITEILLEIAQATKFHVKFVILQIMKLLIV